MPPPDLAIPILPSRSVNDTLAFYRRLGFEGTISAFPFNYAILRRGAVELHLQWGDAGQWAHPGDRPAYRFPTDDVDALYHEFSTAGALMPESRSPYAAPADTPWGTREFHLRDPAGNVLQFYA